MFELLPSINLHIQHTATRMGNPVGMIIKNEAAKTAARATINVLRIGSVYVLSSDHISYARPFLGHE